MVMNPPSFERFEPLVQKDGVLIVNASLIATPSKRADIRVIAIPANEIAAELGAAQMANVIMVGALVAATGALKLETLDQILEEHISARHRDKIEANKKALRRGAALA
jgi:2-oxoglutarate ferredoxin oxidoreductase subunit gamma